MKKMLPIFVSLILAGCGGGHLFGQVPPTKADIVWSWNAPAGCTASAPCSYYISVLTVANGTASCPASTGNSYVPINGGAATSATTLTDTGESMGTTVCAIAQTLQNGLTSAWSVPSNAVVMPASAPVPGPPSGTEKAAELQTPAMPAAGARGNKVAAATKELAMAGRVSWLAAASGR